ncbi:MAG TPA: hypothetical protein VKX33_01385 [Cyclobacteriaceae bacterium]|nr:hypothetical protein [Cyclobacteriaceae bacterium]
MEVLDLQQLSLILDQDLVILQEDVPKLLSWQKTDNQEEYTEEINEITYEGNFEKGILVMFQGNELESSHREFLLKILGAVGCSLKDVALISSGRILELPEESINRLNPRKCLVFGTFSHPIMQFKTSTYEVISGETEYFFADAMEDLVENIPLKRSLWNGLQVLFQIKK